MSDEGAVIPRKKKLLDRFLELWARPLGRLLIIGGSVLLMAIPLIVYRCAFPGGLSGESDDWGNFGSFAGGIYGSLFSFLTIIYLLVVNRKEREEAKEQAELQERRFREQMSVERMKRDSEYIFDLIERHDLALNQALNNEDQRKNKSYMLDDIFRSLRECENKIHENGLMLKCERYSSDRALIENEITTVRKTYGDYWIKFSKVNRIFCFTETNLQNAVADTMPELIVFWHNNLDLQEVMLLATIFGYDENCRKAYTSNMGPDLTMRYAGLSFRLYKYWDQFRAK